MQILAHIVGPSGSGKTTFGNRIKKKIQFSDLLIKDFINKNKTSNIILTGTNTLSNNNDFSDQIVYEIYAKYKYFIDLEIVLKRRFDCHIEYISLNLDNYFNKALKNNKLFIDLELYKKKIQARYNLEYYKKNK